MKFFLTDFFYIPCLWLELLMLMFLELLILLVVFVLVVVDIVGRENVGVEVVFILGGNSQHNMQDLEKSKRKGRGGEKYKTQNSDNPQNLISVIGLQGVC